MIGEDVRKPKGDKDEAVCRLFDQLSRGIKRRKREERRWEHVEKFEDMKQWAGEEGSFDEVTVNKLGSYIRNYRAQVTYNDPRVKLTPKTSDGWEPIPVPVAGPGGQPKLDANGQVLVREVVPAKAREALLNDIVSAPMQHIQQTSGLLTKSGVLGWGCLKAGYRPVFETALEPDGDQVIPIRDNKLDLSQFQRNRFDGSLMEDDSGRLITRNSVPIWEDFFICWVPYRNMIIDPDGGNYWDDHQWVAEEEVRSLKSVKADPLFKNTEDLKPSGMAKDEDDDLSFNWDANGSDWSEEKEDPEKSDRKVVRLFHIYDLVNERYIVLADGHGKALRDVPWTEIKIVDHPYSDFRPNQILGEFYPRPLGTDLAPINEWYNIARQMELRGMKRSTRKILARKGVLDSVGMDRLTDDEDMAWVELDIMGHQNLTDAFVAFNPPPLSEAIYANSARIAQDFAEVGGMTDEARGASTADTATQVSVMEAYSGTRIEHDRKILAECWRRIFKKLNDSIDANMTRERAIMVQGADGQVFQALVDPDMIAGDFDVDVDFEEMAPPNTAQQAAGRAQIAQIAGQAPHLFMSEALVRGWCEPYGIKDGNFIKALAEASQMQMQMLMMQGQQAPGPVPEAGEPESEADAIAQTGAGTQTPRMQGAS